VATALALCCAALLLGACDSGEGEGVSETEVTTPVDAGARERLQALALEPDIENGLQIYRICAECHQPEGWGMPDGSYPQLAGQHRTVVIKQLADIRAGLRKNPEMLHFASMEQIGGAQAVADVAGYIDTLEISVDNGKGPGDDLERGATLYAANCARCHGDSGEGDGDRYIPRIQSQHYAYLLRQFQAIRAGDRANADPDMAAHIQGISDADARAILDWVSRSEPPEPFQAPPGWSNPDFPD
jgi:cytochrome c553